MHTMSEPVGTAIGLQELPELRRKTEAVAKVLQEQLSGHLETVRLLFAPERIFGKYAGGKADVTGDARSLAELQQRYKPFENRPFGLTSNFDVHWLTLIGTGVVAQPWEYVISLQGSPITMTSPVKWVLAYQSSSTLTKARALLTSKDAARPPDLRQTVVNALALNLLLTRFPGIVQLFRDLRFEIATEQLPEFPSLPITTITTCLTSFRPSNELVANVTAFSGVPSFIELIDLETVRQPRDIFREKLAGVLG
jgi:hypothetical protein